MAELYPVVEIVGHLHRPEAIDPGKYPIRIVFTQDDMDDAVDRGRLVTKVIYLEDPDQAIPFKLPKDQVSVLTLNPTEPPLRVATALGRPVAIVRLGRPPAHCSRKSRGELPATSGSTGSRASARSRARSFVIAARAARCRAGRCAYHRHRRLDPRCRVTSISATAATAATAAGPSNSGRISGIEPRDAVVRFDIGVKGVSQARVLPTNVVCVYAPRFAEVRVSTGTNQNIDIQTTKTDKTIAKLVQADSSAESRRLVQNQAAELARARARATAYKGRLMADEDSNSSRTVAPTREPLWRAVNLQKQTAELARNRYKVGSGAGTAPPGRHQVGRGAGDHRTSPRGRAKRSGSGVRIR